LFNELVEARCALSAVLQFHNVYAFVELKQSNYRISFANVLPMCTAFGNFLETLKDDAHSLSCYIYLYQP
jgi:hypothetical protein